MKIEKKAFASEIRATEIRRMKIRLYLLYVFNNDHCLYYLYNNFLVILTENTN